MHVGVRRCFCARRKYHEVLTKFLGSKGFKHVWKGVEGKYWKAEKLGKYISSSEGCY